MEDGFEVEGQAPVGPGRSGLVSSGNGPGKR
jgi:hypothetical protein